MKLMTLTACAMTLLGAPVLAQTTLEDTDGNGVFSMEELQVAYPDMDVNLFIAVDTDESGEVSVDELTAAQESGLIPALG